MIDQSIHEVYQRDKKVFIPDFGAIIYSEVTDKIDFNDLLTFDDGKIIAEMQKQQQISEEEARNELDEYVQRVKSALNQGQLHFFAGIGYLSKDSQGSYAIEKATSTTDDQSEAKEPEPAKAKKKQIKKPTTKSVKKPRTKTKKEDIVNEAVKDDVEPVSEEEIDQVPLKDQIEPIFSNGKIELDIRGKDQAGRSFVGVAFHGVDESTFDAVYFRPFNFKHPERKGHSVQYISHPGYTWFKLREEFPEKYENPVSPVPDPNDWFHATVVVEYPMVYVYVNNSTEPSLTVEQLSSRKQGWIGFWVGNNSEGWFKNLKIVPD